MKCFKISAITRCFFPIWPIYVITFSLVDGFESRKSYFLMTSNHVVLTKGPIKVLEVTDEFDCQLHCLRDQQCTSVNFRKLEEGHHQCELQNSTEAKYIVPSYKFDFYQKLEELKVNWGEWGAWIQTGCSLPSTCLPTRNRTCMTPDVPCNGPDTEAGECPPAPLFDRAACDGSLGMEDGRIKDIQITASSYHQYLITQVYNPRNGRLNKGISASSIGGWVPGGQKVNEYMQIDLMMIKVITKVATQGRKFDGMWKHWVTKYGLSYSNDTITWKKYQGDCVKIFPGNVDNDGIVINELEVPIRARYIRLIVKEYSTEPALRMELYGCNSLPV